MSMINLFQLNDLNIKSFLKIILAVQLVVWAVIGLDAMGLEIPILRQLIGFIYLTLVPGIIILRILKLHKLGNIETLLYTVGLSIATLMFTGLFMNTVYPLFGISRPISIVPFIITMSILVLILCIISYVIDKDFSDPSYIDIKDVLSPRSLFLYLLPFLSIFGTYLANFHQSYILLILLIIIIAFIAGLVAFDMFIPKSLYPLAVLMIAIALLYMFSLISMYLPGWDIHQEYQLVNLVKINSIWDPTISHVCNAMLSIVMLAPIYSIILNMDLTWVFKIIYPLLYSLMPLGLYHVFQKQTNDKTAFLSCFFLMSIVSFSTMVTLARQEIAELFLILLMLLMIDKNMDKIKRSVLFIVFAISLVVSHYGLSYIYMFCLISAWLLLFLMDNPAIQKSGDDFHSKFRRKRERPVLVGNPNSLKIKDRTISSTFVILFVVFTLTWYMYLSSSSAFNTIVYIGDHIGSCIYTDFLNPEAAQGLKMMIAEPQPGLLHEINRIIHYLIQIFIIIGCIVLLLKHRKLKFESEYVAFSMVNLVILFASVSVPFFTSSLNMNRLYHITLLFLAPVCVIGGVIVFRFLSQAFKFVSYRLFNIQSKLKKNNYINLQTLPKLLSIFFVMFFLFNTGFIYLIAGESVYQFSMNPMEKTNETTVFDQSYPYKCDVLSAQWLSTNIKAKDRIYADYMANEMILISYGMQPFAYYHAHDLSNTSRVYGGSYIYLRRTNVVKGVIMGRGGNMWNTTDVLPPSEKIDVIYTNGGSEIYYYE